MKKIYQLLDTINSDQNTAYAILRSFLGIVLFVRGWIFLTNPDAILALVDDKSYFMWYSFVAIGHLAGGFCLATGIFTRLGALIQLPILIGAIFVIQEQALVKEGQSLELATLVLFMLIVFFVYGSGRLSLGKRFSFPNL